MPQMHQKVCGYRKDLEAFQRVINELVIDGNELPEVRNHQVKTLNLIKVNHLYYIYSNYFINFYIIIK